MKRIILLCALALLALSCTEQRYRVSPFARKPQMAVARYDREFFETGTIADDAFRRLYEEKILQVGEMDAPQSEVFLEIFRTDSDMCRVYADCGECFDQAFQSAFERKVSKAFLRLCTFIEDMPLPALSFHLSGFGQSVVSAPDILSVSVDKYLGGDYPLYADLFYDYQLVRMSPERMAADCLNAWIRSEFSEENLLSDSRVLDYMVYEGKILFLLRKVMPDEPFEYLAGWNREQADWCRANERNMWERLNAYEQLYERDRLMARNYFGENPTTVYFPPEAPGRALCWVGYQMVARYMAAEPSCDLLSLMMETDAERVLTRSVYRP